MSPASTNRTPSWAGLFKVAIVGAASLRGKELKDTLEERSFPSREVVLLDDDESLGQIEAVGDEATFIHGVTRNSFEDVDLVFFAGDPGFTRRQWQHAQNAGCTIVDLSYALEADPSVPIRSPWLEKEAQTPREKSGFDLETTAVMAAHPATTMLGLLLHRIRKTGLLRSAAITLFDPVSEHGRKGMDELHQQTLNLLSFQPMPKEVFDVQIAFNLVSRYGEDAKATIEDSEKRILHHLRRLGVVDADPPALQVLQAPTFHGHIASFCLELSRPTEPDDFLARIEGEHLKVVSAASDSPSNVNAAGQDDIHVAARRDATRPSVLWLWTAADNLKISAITATESALALLATRPSGKIQ